MFASVKPKFKKRKPISVAAVRMITLSAISRSGLTASSFTASKLKASACFLFFLRSHIGVPPRYRLIERL